MSMANKSIYKISCLECKKEISLTQFNRHYRSKSCLTGKTHYTPLSECPHCASDLSDVNSANHIRWCKKNPKRSDYENGSARAIIAMNKARKESGRLNEFACAKLDGIPIPAGYNAGKIGLGKGRRHSEETKKLMSEKARNNNYQRVCKTTHDYTDKRGRVYRFDSSWEDALADRLDFLDIDWDRPDAIKYIDAHGKSRNYFPDFYLPKYDVYLDPKNNYVSRVQHDKLLRLSIQIKLLVLTLDQCNNFDIDMIGLVL